MFVGVARVTLQIPQSGSLKDKRQVLRRISERVQSKFNVSLAEVEDNDFWQKATLALAVVGNEGPHVNRQLDTVIDFIERLYLAPLSDRQIELIPLGSQLYGSNPTGELRIPKGDRSLAEAEGLGGWEERYAPSQKNKGRVPLEAARQKARGLRNRREWEKK